MIARRLARPAPAGFTLIEMVVVLAIVGLTAAVVVPAVARWTGGRWSDAAEELAGAYRLARDAALTRGVTASVAVELGTGSYWVYAASARGSGHDTLLAGRLPLGRDARLSGGRAGWAVTRFDALGRTRGDAVLVSNGRAAYEIRPHPFTGAIDARAQ